MVTSKWTKELVHQTISRQISGRAGYNEARQCGYVTATAGLLSKVGQNSLCNSVIAPPFNKNVFLSNAIAG